MSFLYHTLTTYYRNYYLPVSSFISRPEPCKVYSLHDFKSDLTCSCFSLLFVYLKWMFLKDLYKSGRKSEGCSRKGTHLSFLFFPWIGPHLFPQKEELLSYTLLFPLQGQVLHVFISVISKWKSCPMVCCQVPSLQKCFSSSLSIRLTRTNLLSADKASNLPLLSYFRDISIL